jgi:hypothetical protein
MDDDYDYDDKDGPYPDSTGKPDGRAILGFSPAYQKQRDVRV